ncbi:MAG TPA: hypothetical protein VFI47_23675 [Acidimicrobiales bacterium]|nr:hypothetical protein [Acidimicrobiales bacterium]
MERVRVGCYPGTFNPPTVAHLAIAEAAVRQAGLDRLDLVLSTVALGKERLAMPPVEDRCAVLADVARARPWLGVVVTDARLIVDAAADYDVVVMGADKWAQVLDPDWYGSVAARDEGLDRLPRVLVAPRAGCPLDLAGRDAEVLAVAGDVAEVSATAVRSGEGRAQAWLLPEARAWARRARGWPGWLDAPPA